MHVVAVGALAATSPEVDLQRNVVTVVTVEHPPQDFSSRRGGQSARSAILLIHSKSLNRVKPFRTVTTVTHSYRFAASFLGKYSHNRHDRHRSTFTVILLPSRPCSPKAIRTPAARSPGAARRKAPRRARGVAGQVRA